MPVIAKTRCHKVGSCANRHQSAHPQGRLKALPRVEEDDVESTPDVQGDNVAEARESHQIQATLGMIGHAMGFKIWYPPHDRTAILDHCPEVREALLTSLPIGFDNFTMSTVQAIDVLCIKGRSIIRAFEVEHTTSIYSGLLRMGDFRATTGDHDKPT